MEEFTRPGPRSVRTERRIAFALPWLSASLRARARGDRARSRKNTSPNCFGRIDRSHSLRMPRVFFKRYFGALMTHALCAEGKPGAVDRVLFDGLRDHGQRAFVKERAM
jgi:hypothetical protein